MNDQEINAPTAPPPDVKQLKCKRAMCKTPRLDVKRYSLPDGSMKMSLCINCKATPFGSNFVEVKDSDRAIAQASRQQNRDARTRMSQKTGLDSKTGEYDGEALGQCQYPSCKETGCKTWMTKSPHPLTGIYKGRYCEFHRDLLNSRSRVLPHRIEKASGHISYSLLTKQPLYLSKLTKQFGLDDVMTSNLVGALSTILGLDVVAKAAGPDDEDVLFQVTSGDGGSMVEQVTTVAEKIESTLNAATSEAR